MRIAIDAPAVRSLSANEKMVYRFLKDGLTPTEIAHRMHIPVGKGGYVNQTCELPGESIMGIITSIREKGWDIPTDNKEEAEMAKITEEQKREIVQLAMTKAMSHKDIAAKFGIGKSTVWWLVDQYKKSGDAALSGETEIAEKEPETAATESGSEQEIVPNIPADIVTPSEENVEPLHSFSPLVAEAIWRKVEALREEAIELQDREIALESLISDYKSELRRVDEQLMFVEAEIDSLIEDYEALTGGAAVSVKEK
ncbi:transposase [Huintestinicola sp.]|uniref:transposase n=1 Tax=Huintestinicola sp. TaxID=2981661 RepID=UPI003D7ECB81